MISVGIVGGTGYTGSELLRILARHPQASLVAITSRGEAGQAVADLFPHLRGQIDLKFSEPDVGRLGECDLVFFATPNGTAMRMAPDLLARGAKVIDLAADFRLKDPAIWARWYEMPTPAPSYWPRRFMACRRSIALPFAMRGWWPIPVAILPPVTLGFLPLLEQGWVDPSWLVADAKSGVSGAGRKASVGMLMAEVGESFKAYAVTGHRHQPEIFQNLSGGSRSGSAADVRASSFAHDSWH
jgi:N-acetyl-gamma-glutamyl-phosphate reductase